MIRRVALVAMLMLLGEYPLAQIVIYMFQSIAFTAYLAYYRPLEDRKQLKIEIFNECMTGLAAQTLFAFTDFQSDGFDPVAKYNFGWYLTGLILVTILVNTLLSLWDSLLDAYMFFK
jgi:hypothetical protein